MSTPQPQPGSSSVSAGSPATTPASSAGSLPATTTPPPATVPGPQGTGTPGTGTPGTGTQGAGTPATDKQISPTRTGMVWVSVCIAVLLAILLIIFLAQNTKTVAVHYLGLSGSTSLALMLLIAAVAGALITVIAGSARIIQLRRRAGRK